MIKKLSLGVMLATVATLTTSHVSWAADTFTLAQFDLDLSGLQGPAGTGINYKGEVENCTELAAKTGMVDGDAWYNRDDTLLYIYETERGGFPSCPNGGVPFRGPQGEQGPTGPAGPTGPTGPQGPKDCAKKIVATATTVDTTRGTQIIQKNCTQIETYAMRYNNSTKECEQVSQKPEDTQTVCDGDQGNDGNDGTNGCGDIVEIQETSKTVSGKTVACKKANYFKAKMNTAGTACEKAATTAYTSAETCDGPAGTDGNDGLTKCSHAVIPTATTQSVERDGKAETLDCVRLDEFEADYDDNSKKCVVKSGATAISSNTVCSGKQGQDGNNGTNGCGDIVEIQETSKTVSGKTVACKKANYFKAKMNTAGTACVKAATTAYTSAETCDGPAGNDGNDGTNGCGDITEVTNTTKTVSGKTVNCKKASYFKAKMNSAGTACEKAATTAYTYAETCDGLAGNDGRDGCAPRVTQGEIDPKTGCYDITTQNMALVNGVCVADGDPIVKKMCSSCPALLTTAQVQVTDRADSNVKLNCTRITSTPQVMTSDGCATDANADSIVTDVCEGKPGTDGNNGTNGCGDIVEIQETSKTVSGKTVACKKANYFKAKMNTAGTACVKAATTAYTSAETCDGPAGTDGNDGTNGCADITEVTNTTQTVDGKTVNCKRANYFKAKMNTAGTACEKAATTAYTYAETCDGKPGDTGPACPLTFTTTTGSDSTGAYTKVTLKDCNGTTAGQDFKVYDGQPGTAGEGCNTFTGQKVDPTGSVTLSAAGLTSSDINNQSTLYAAPGGFKTTKNDTCNNVTTTEYAPDACALIKVSRKNASSNAYSLYECTSHKQCTGTTCTAEKYYVATQNAVATKVLTADAKADAAQSAADAAQETANGALQADSNGKLPSSKLPANTVVDADYATVKANANSALQSLPSNVVTTETSGTIALSKIPTLTSAKLPSGTVIDSTYSSVKTKANNSLQKDSTTGKLSASDLPANTVVDADYATVKANANSALQSLPSNVVTTETSGTIALSKIPTLTSAKLPANTVIDADYATVKANANSALQSIPSTYVQTTNGKIADSLISDTIKNGAAAGATALQPDSSGKLPANKLPSTAVTTSTFGTQLTNNSTFTTVQANAAKAADDAAEALEEATSASSLASQAKATADTALQPDSNGKLPAAKLPANTVVDSSYSTVKTNANNALQPDSSGKLPANKLPSTAVTTSTFGTQLTNNSTFTTVQTTANGAVQSSGLENAIIALLNADTCNPQVSSSEGGGSGLGTSGKTTYDPNCGDGLLNAIAEKLAPLFDQAASNVHPAER